MIVLTGGAGFIGSCLLARLNELGFKDIVVVDHLDGDDDPKHLNLKNKKFIRFIDKKEFIDQVQQDQIKEPIDLVLHMGACSSTTGTDEDYYEQNNFIYSVEMLKWSLAKEARFIYASSAATYGDGDQGYSDDPETIKKYKPLNIYGRSKQKFDEWVLEHGFIDKVVGLKFFNVFGPNEYHKGDMKSVVAKSYQRVVDEGKIALFKSYKPEFHDGEQKRDFIYVKDVLKVIIFFINHPQVNGIFNVGTGKAQSWNDLANALFKAVGKTPNIEYIDMPEHLKKRYQYFTEADMARMRHVGYNEPFLTLDDAVLDYVSYLKEQRHY